MVTQPASAAIAGAPFNPQPAIGIGDQFGNIRSSANGTADNSTVVTAARSGGTGTLQGTLTATAANGVATLTNLFHTNANTITISFTSGTLTNASANILVNPAAADRLVFTNQPGSGVTGAPLTTQPAVHTRDQFGNDSASGLPPTLNLTMSLGSGSGPLLGTTITNIGTVGANGVVAFTDLRVDSVGTDKRLTATVTGPPELLSATSDLFSVGKGNQTITFPSLPNRVYGEVFTLTSTASSGLPVSFAIVSGPASLSNSVITVTGIGTVTVRTNQAGDTNFNAAADVDRSFTATKANVTVSLGSSPNPSLPDQQVGFNDHKRRRSRKWRAGWFGAIQGQRVCAR